MKTYKQTLAAVIGIMLATPLQACVVFSIDFSYNPNDPTSCSTTINAGLTDNGRQVCSLTNVQGTNTDCTTAGYNLACISGYSAYFNVYQESNIGYVEYAYGSFSQTFQTNPGKMYDNNYYYQTSVDGC